MKTFLKKIGAFLTGVRVWSINLLTLLILVYVIGAIAILIRQLPGTVDPQGKVLIVSPDGHVLDQEAFPAEVSFPFSMPDTKQIQSRDLIKLIRSAAADDRIAGVLLDFGKTTFAGMSTALNIADELAALRESGKQVIAYSEALSNSSYLMAAQANEVYVHPSGAVAISGLGGYRNYTRELTEKLQITIHNYSQGDFKSAVEGLTRNDMSESDRLQQIALLGPLWNTMKQRMAQARNIDASLFQSMADNQPVVLAREAAYDNLAFAREHGVIDGTMTFPELRAHMIEKFGKSEEDARETYPHISSDAYFAQLELVEEPVDDAVAVVFVEGVIQPGRIGPGIAGADDISALIRRAHEDENTRAIVLRVNSPGGSIIGSDIIRDELEAATRKAIPVVVSMGDVAASGGVWVSTPADSIFAEPNTITGSIGVAIAFPTLENVFDYAGVNFDGVTTSEFAGWGLHRGVDARLDAIFARWASSAYLRFVDLVAAGRDREPDYIRSIAGGRVWLADKAKEVGLVDEFGTLEDAISAAAQRAGVPEYRVNYVVQEMSPTFAFLRRFLGTASLEAASPYGEFAQRVSRLLSIVQGISQPRATVMCTRCMVELH
jgi:protease-4